MSTCTYTYSFSCRSPNSTMREECDRESKSTDLTMGITSVRMFSTELTLSVVIA